MNLCNQGVTVISTQKVRVSKYVLNTPILKRERGLKICPLDPLQWSFALSGPTTGGADALKDTLNGGTVLSVPSILSPRFVNICTDKTKTMVTHLLGEAVLKASEPPLGSFFHFLKNHAFAMRQAYCSICKM